MTDAQTEARAIVDRLQTAIANVRDEATPDAVNHLANTATAAAISLTAKDAKLAAVKTELNATVRKFNCDNADEFWSNISKLREKSENWESRANERGVEAEKWFREYGSALERAERAEAALALAVEEREFWREDAARDQAQLAEAINALRGDWQGVYLDGRNKHGSHVIRLPQRSIELEHDDARTFLKDLAETILSDAEALGFVVDDAVVATFDRCLDDGFFSHYEYVGVSSELTAMFYGSTEDQAARRAREAQGGE